MVADRRVRGGTQRRDVFAAKNERRQKDGSGCPGSSFFRFSLAATMKERLKQRMARITRMEEEGQRDRIRTTTCRNLVFMRKFLRAYNVNRLNPKDYVSRRGAGTRGGKDRGCLVALCVSASLREDRFWLRPEAAPSDLCDWLFLCPCGKTSGEDAGPTKRPIVRNNLASWHLGILAPSGFWAKNEGGHVPTVCVTWHVACGGLDFWGKNEGGRAGEGIVE
jgi:hypothetical protein